MVALCPTRRIRAYHFDDSGPFVTTAEWVHAGGDVANAYVVVGVTQSRAHEADHYLALSRKVEVDLVGLELAGRAHQQRRLGLDHCTLAFGTQR